MGPPAWWHGPCRLHGASLQWSSLHARGQRRPLRPREQARGGGWLIPEAPTEKSQKPLMFMPWIFPDHPLTLTLPGLRPLPGALCVSLPKEATTISGSMTCSRVALGKLLSLSEPQDTHLSMERITCTFSQDGSGEETASLERVLGR